MPDRLAALLASTTLNGIDFVEILTPDQQSLRVHFLNAVTVEGTLVGSITITGGESVPEVPVTAITPASWAVDDAGRPTLDLQTPFRGDFSFYSMHIPSTALDPYYASVRFTFKAGCPSLLDCAVEPRCEEPPTGGPQIDYLAKDFTSFRRALLDYSATAYPNWVEHDEPDVGMMLLEVLSAAGDDLSYLQDRVANEAAFATATQRSSLVRHARLVDYEPRPATSAQTLVQIDVTTATVPQGIVIEASRPDGGVLSFELGDGLVDPETAALVTGALRVDPRWNRGITPYLWDDSQECLPIGATEMWVSGWGHAFPVGDPQRGTVGLAVLIDTHAINSVDPPTREVVHLTAAIEETDALLGDVAVTHLKWDASEALTAEHALERTVLAGNLVPAVEGARFVDEFVIDPDPSGLDARLAAVARGGPDAGCGDAMAYHLHTLVQGRLAWLTRTDGSITPEISVVEEPRTVADEPRLWRWRRSLLDADPFERAYTVEAVAYRDIRTDRTEGLPWFEYDGDQADSVRFGSGTFGERPEQGSRFMTTYRVTTGRAGNVAADAITTVPPALRSVVTAATNPFPATGGADEETVASVRANAPQAFRARQFRALRAEDYTKAAEELAWVLDAGTQERWTGSWLTVFTEAQPRGHKEPTLDEHLGLVRLLDRRRVAGYEVFTPDPRYIGLDLIVTVCAHAWALRGEVEAAVLEELGTTRICDGRWGFFAPGQLRFGTPLERSRLEAAIQQANGVEGVVQVRYRRRGYLTDFVPMPEAVTPARNEIIRVDNDPSEPDRGSLRIVVEGGK